MDGEKSDNCNEPKKFAVAAGLSVLVAAIFDLLFYGHQEANLNAALFLLALFILGVPFRKGYYDSSARIATVAVTALFLLSAFWNIGFLNFCGTLTGLMIIRFSAAYGDESRTLGWFPRFLIYGATFWADLLAYLSDNAKKLSFNISRAGAFVVTAFATALISLFFLRLFAVGSPQIKSMLVWVGEYADSVNFDLLRIAVWGIVALSAFSFFAMHICGRFFGAKATKAAVSETPDNGEPKAPKFMTLPLAVFNLVFAVQTFFDVKYFLGGLELPDGITYSEFAIHGTNALAFATIVAAALIILIFWRGGRSDDWTRLRVLVYIWLAQNFLLCIAACARLCMYTRAYDLTCARLFGFSFFALVMAGLVFTVVKIAKDKSVRWLVDRCIYAFVGYVFFWSFFDAGKFSADYNVARYISGENPKIDKAYLSRLGVSSLPARLGLYIHMNGKGEYFGPKEYVKSIEDDVWSLKRETENWRGFSLRNFYLLKAIEKPFADFGEIERSKPKRPVSADGGDNY